MAWTMVKDSPYKSTLIKSIKVGVRYCKNPREESGIAFAPSLNSISGMHVIIPLRATNTHSNEDIFEKPEVPDSIRYIK